MRIQPLAIAAVLLATSTASAQTSYPMLMDLQPVAAQVGQTSEHTVLSRYDLRESYQVLVTGTGVTGEVVKPEKWGDKDLTSLKLKFTVAADALPGVREFRIATPRGASTVGQLVIARDPVVDEAKKNDIFAEAQPFTLPATLCGAIEKNEDVDFYKFQVEAGTALTFHVRCARLQDRIHDLQQHADPIVTLKNSSGVDLAQVDNSFFADPLLHYRFEQAGEYYLEIRDLRYQGNRYWQYSVEVSNRPFVTNVFPMQVNPGAEATLLLSGHTIPEAPARLTVPSETAESVQDLLINVGNLQLGPVPVFVSSLPIAVEQPGDNNDPAKAQPVALPAGINGRIESEADLDCYRFEAKQGQRFTFEVLARRYQSSVDPVLRVLNAKGKQLSENDDLRDGRHTYADSLIENWAAPADGQYVLEIRDLQLRGGDSFVYVLKATEAAPSFDLKLDSDKTLIAPGVGATLFVRAYRRSGFAGEIQLAVDGLPAGVTAQCGRILADREDGAIVLACADGAMSQLANLTVTGTAVQPMPDGKSMELSATAESMQEIYMPGGGRSHFPVALHTLSVCQPLDLLSVKIEPAEITLAPGGSQKIAVTIERAKGFDKNVTLDVAYRHLNSVFADVLPKGVKIDTKNSKTLINGKASTGHITLVADKDVKPVEQQVVPVMAHVSVNFVMKISYCAPLLVTVKK